MRTRRVSDSPTPRQMIPDEYIGPFSNWAERHAFIVGLTLGVMVGKPPFRWLVPATTYILGRDSILRQELETQGHYFLAGVAIGYAINGGGRG